MSYFESCADKEQSGRYKRIPLSIIMAYLHCRTRTRILTANPMATHYTETVPIARTRTQIPI